MACGRIALQTSKENDRRQVKQCFLTMYCNWSDLKIDSLAQYPLSSLSITSPSVLDLSECEARVKIATRNGAETLWEHPDRGPLDIFRSQVVFLYNLESV
jgi:hypothetical protein